MALKVLFCIAAIIACVHARPGGPAAYSISAPSVDHASVGSTQEHTVKGHLGQSSQSQYASQVQTAHSQSHVQRTSISNDAGLAPGHLVAAPIAAHAAYAPTAHYAQPAAIAVAHTAPAISHGITYAAAAPAISHGITYAAAAPAISHGLTYAAAAPAISHGISYAAAAPAYSHGYAAPAYAHQSYAATAPALQISTGSLGHYAAAAPALSHGYALAAAPAATAFKVAAAVPAYAHGLLGHAGVIAGPALAPSPLLSHYGAPVLKAAVAAPALVHTSVTGHGVHYGI